MYFTDLMDVNNLSEIKLLFTCPPGWNMGRQQNITNRKFEELPSHKLGKMFASVKYEKLLVSCMLELWSDSAQQYRPMEYQME